MTTPDNANDYDELGNPIYRYGEPDKPFTPAGDSPHREELEAHLARHLGEPETVFHELLSHLVHVDVYFIAPTLDRPFYTLVTAGMSDRPMTTPEGYPEYQHAELLIHLPPDWPAIPEPDQTGEEMGEDAYWPIRSLKFLAHFPHEYDTWLGPGHTIPNGDPPVPFSGNTRLSGMMLLWPVALPDAFSHLALPGKTVNFYLLFPLYPEEMKFKLQQGADALLARLDAAGIGPVVDLDRPNVGNRDKLCQG